MLKQSEFMMLALAKLNNCTRLLLLVYVWVVFDQNMVAHI